VTTAADTLTKKIDDFANQRESPNNRLYDLELARRQSKAMSEIKESDAKEMLAAMAENLPHRERDALKDLLRRIVELITLNLPELTLELAADGQRL
jgi:uncharacterized FAD-dependent dehydrogenase